MELKSPAGTLKSALAALDAGADSVYVGLADANDQRRQLVNLTRDELRTLAAKAREGNRQVLVTLNSSATSEDWDRLVETLDFLSSVPIHGVIVSDLGLIAFIARSYPSLRILVSVQAECSNVEHAKLLADLGAHRVVLERNVSVREARRIREQAGIEVELFVFGYSCNSQDSICYMGDYWSGSPCNVHCAQKIQFLGVPGLDKPRRYLFMQYYSALKHLPALADAGIDGLKIEGRQRSSDYVRNVTRIFRSGIDELKRTREAGLPFHVHADWQRELERAAMNFEVTDGFFVVNDYQRTVLEDPSVTTVARYAADTLRNLAEGQTSLEFLRRSFVGHVRRAVSRPELDDKTSGRTIKGL